MIKISVDSEKLISAQNAHYNAILSYVKKKNFEYKKTLFECIEKIIPQQMSFEETEKSKNWTWLSDFILADVETLRKFVTNAENLKFEQFKKLYNGRFCAGYAKYVDDDSKYNAYTFIENLGITVCPYCDAEFLDVLESDEFGTIRTLEIDHFFPKGDYPTLAMCFYNLIPSGQNCNRIKKELLLGMNPYEEEIESCTYLFPDLPIGVNMETVSVEECTIKFHPQKGMMENVKTLRLEERYIRHRSLAHRYLTLKQQYNETKIQEFVKTGLAKSEDAAYRILYNEPLKDDGQQILQKLKRDITGR